MKRALFGLLLLGLIFSSCSKPEEKPTVLSVDIWVGASPIYYAESVGWLDEANVKLLIAPSITDNLKNFTSKAADMVTGTNREYKVLKKITPDLTAVVVYDRSFGGDVIMANRSVEELKKSPSIGVYLEQDTVGEEMWDYFIRYEGLEKEKCKLYGRFQEELSKMKSDERTDPQVIVSYNPHNIPLLKNGYRQIASSKDERYLIVDGIYTTKTFAAEHHEQLKKLNDVLTKAVEVYHKDPKRFYEKVKKPLGNPSYEEFLRMTKNIEWILPLPSASIQAQLEASDYSTKGLVR